MVKVHMNTANVAADSVYISQVNKHAMLQLLWYKSTHDTLCLIHALILYDFCQGLIHNIIVWLQTYMFKLLSRLVTQNLLRARRWQSCFHNVPVFSFSHVVVFRSVWWTCEMRDTVCPKEAFKGNKFAPMSEYNVTIFLLNRFYTSCLNIGKIVATWDLDVRGYSHMYLV